MSTRKFTNPVYMLSESLFSASTKTCVVFTVFVIIGLFSVFNVIYDEHLEISNSNNNNNNNIAFAQSPQPQTQEQESLSKSSLDNNNNNNKVTIDVNSVEFAPLTTSTGNQLKVLVDYHTNDASVVNTPLSGVMKVYLDDGTRIKTSSIPNDFVMGQSGIIQFATTFTDEAIQNVKADIVLTNPLETEQISNTITTTASLTMG